MSDDVVIDQEDDSIDDESSVRCRPKSSVENTKSSLCHGLVDAMSDIVISLVSTPAISLDPGLDDILWVGRHPGTDPCQSSSYKQPQVVILPVPAENLK